MPLLAKPRNDKGSEVLTQTLEPGLPKTLPPFALHTRVLFFEASTHAPTPHADYFSARMAADCAARSTSRAAGCRGTRRHTTSHAQTCGDYRYARTESVFVRAISGMVCRCGEKAAGAGRLQRQRARRSLRRRAQRPERSRAFLYGGTSGFRRTPAAHERVSGPPAGHHR